MLRTKEIISNDNFFQFKKEKQLFYPIFLNKTNVFVCVDSFRVIYYKIIINFKV